MENITEVNVFAVGDSAKISTWSNVPFFFTQTLISKGIKVNRVNIEPSRLLRKAYELTIWKVLRLFNHNTSYEYFRTLTNYIDTKLRIRKAVKRYPRANLNIFLTFSFSASGLNGKPTIQFCDWTYDHYFKYSQNRKPDFLEGLCVKRENKQIEMSDLVIALFPGVACYMKKYYKNPNIFYLGNVINSIETVDAKQVLENKDNSNSIVFIGSSDKYIEGAVQLIGAFKKLKNEMPQLTINLIGIKNSDLKNNIPLGVKCYGYLDKGKDEDRETYYSLLRNARIFVNTTPKWGAFSAAIEAMYFHNPVIVTNYQEFTETFGRNINFGEFCPDNSPDSLAICIRKIFSDHDYKQMCINAHEAVKEYTWDALITKIIKMAKEKL